MRTTVTFILVFFSVLFGFVLSVSAKNYKGAELRTKEAYLYGRFEVRYKASAGNGLVSTFFTYHELQSTSEWNEIDIEIHGRYMDDVQLTTITPNQIPHLRHQFVNFNPHLDFHTYAFEWTPDYVAWFIDDIEVYRQTEEHIKTLTRPQKIMMNIWNPIHENWVGKWDERILPRFAYYDFVSYSSYTPGSGNTGTDNNFTIEWKDEFDFWNQNRWEKATHTFSGNNCDFVPENVVFKDGQMILCLTNSTDLGYKDQTKPAALWARADQDKIIVRFSEEIDKNSAERTSNYVVSGVVINKATLLKDERTVELSVTGLQLSEAYNLFVLGIKDNFPGNNSLIGQSLKIEMPAPLAFPIKINVGGSTYLDYLPDQPWGPETEYGYLDGEEGYQHVAISNTDEDEIFYSERRGLAAYKVRVPNGNYRVTLMMAENYFTQIGKRYFDIYVESELIAKNIDLVTGAVHSAVFITLENVQIHDKVLDIHFCAGLDYPLLNGLVIESIGTEVNEADSRVPEEYSLLQNYPNPFNSSTTITYFLPSSGHVSLNIYDSLGNKLSRLVDHIQISGKHSIVWKAGGSSGVYFCELIVEHPAKTFVQYKKMLLLK